MKDFDLEGIESVGEVWGEVNLEALAALRPDVIISTADLILYDARAHAPGPDELAKLPVWPTLPAVEAGQIAPWHMEEAVSYALFAGHVEELTAKVAEATRLA